MNRNYSIIEKKGTHGNISIDKMADAASGIVVNDECKMKYLELKAKRNYRFIIFKIQETIQQVVIEKLGEPNDKYENLIASLPLDECRYAIFDLDGDYRKSKTVFIAWSPDSSRVRSKMLYACSKDRFIKELDGVQIELQANDVTKKDRSRLEVKQVISSTSKMCFPMRKFRANNNRRLLDFGRSIDFQYMLLVLYLAKFTSVLLFDKLNRKKVKNSGKIIGSVVAENMNWLKKCAVGWMKEFLPVGMIIEEIKKEGIVTVEIKRMEGDMVLLYFENELEVQRLEEENWVSLLKIFKKVEKWSENLTVSKRSTWISCFGVPVHCWNIDTFRDIANRVGEFIEIDKDTKIMKTFTRGNIHIYTDKKQRIEELMELQVGNCVHNIRVVEIENDCISNLSCCCGNFFQQSNETLSYSDEPMVKSYVHGEIGGEDHETGKSEVEDDDVLNHDVLKKSVCDEICIRDKLSPRLSEVGDVEDKLSHMTNNTDANSVALSEIEAGRVDDNSVVNHLSEDQETRRKSEITDMKLKFFDDLDRKNGRSFEVRVSDSIDREAEEVSKFDDCGGLYVDCDDNVILKEFVRG